MGGWFLSQASPTAACTLASYLLFEHQSSLVRVKHLLQVPRHAEDNAKVQCITEASQTPFKEMMGLYACMPSYILLIYALVSQAQCHQQAATIITFHHKTSTSTMLCYLQCYVTTYAQMLLQS